MGSIWKLTVGRVWPDWSRGYFSSGCWCKPSCTDVHLNCIKSWEVDRNVKRRTIKEQSQHHINRGALLFSEGEYSSSHSILFMEYFYTQLFPVVWPHFLSLCFIFYSEFTGPGFPCFAVHLGSAAAMCSQGQPTLQRYKTIGTWKSNWCLNVHVSCLPQAQTIFQSSMTVIQVPTTKIVLKEGDREFLLLLWNFLILSDAMEKRNVLK